MVEQKGYGKSGGHASGAKGKKAKLEGKKAMVLENEGNLLISDDEEDGEDEFRDIGAHPCSFAVRTYRSQCLSGKRYLGQILSPLRLSVMMQLSGLKMALYLNMGFSGNF